VEVQQCMELTSTNRSRAYPEGKKEVLEKIRFNVRF
jgi:hypothetical protein